jgi:hypothetical protein
MSRGDTLERMARTPRDNWSIRDIEIVCRENGLMCKPPRGGGSHFKVIGAGFTLTIPARRKIKPVYISAFVGMIRKIQDERS